MGQSIQEQPKQYFFKGCLPQILLGQFLNTLLQMIIPPFIVVYFIDYHFNDAIINILVSVGVIS